jgi:predicted Zn-dependent peptidase
MIKEEFKDIKENGITEAELEKAKNQLLSSLILGLETTKARMSRMANSYLNFGRIVELDELIEKVNKIELDDIKRVAKEVFSEEYYSISILGDI